MNYFEFPATFNEFKVSRKLSNIEFERVKEGSRPKHMDDKWVIYFEEPWLYFNRSLTGNCIYKAHIVCENSDCRIDRLLINGDPDQLKEEIRKNVDFFLNIFDLFLTYQIR